MNTLREIATELAEDGSLDVRAGTSLGDCDPIDKSRHAGIAFKATDAATVTWHASHDKDGTFTPAKDADGNSLVQAVTASEWNETPVALYAMKFLKALVTAGGATTLIVTKAS
ncbi:MAG: hypothetical protein AAF532_13940 [Planctomycetota bacterium]